MDTSVFYVPALHETSVELDVPSNVSFFASGLESNPDQGDRSEKAIMAQKAAAQALPLAPPEARALLAQIQSMAEIYSPDGMLRQLEAHKALQAQRDTGFRPDEAVDLAAFSADSSASFTSSATGQHAEGPIENHGDVLIDCQKILLLAESLEQRTAEMFALETRFKEAEAALHAALGESGATSPPEGTGVASPAGDATVLVPWRLVVDAALPFLPSGAVLFTADKHMALDLREAGMLQPFPEDKAELCQGWPQELVSGLLFVCLPAWRLVGRNHLPANRPWLAREVEVLVARPKSGWI